MSRGPSFQGENVDGPGESVRRADAARSGTSTARWKRVGAAVLGGWLLVGGLRRRSLVGAAMALAGGWLSYRAIRGPGRRAGTPAPATGDRRDVGEFAAGPTVARSVTVDEPADELSALLRDAETLDRVTGRLADVTAAGETRHRWTVRGPRDRSLSWETELEEDAGGRLRWESVDGPAAFEELSAEFRPDPGDRGTTVTLRARFDPPGGALAGAAVERVHAVPGAFLGWTLDRLKSLAETGEIPTLERNPSARGRGDLL